jgi:hypothetical protein|nr:MAG TPA: Protein of unknown function (DUF1043) [Herelleviridae sp.]
MKTAMIYFALFAVGVGVGVGATWQYAKSRYEKIAQEDFAERRKNLEETKKNIEDTKKNMEAIKETLQVVKEQNDSIRSKYADYTTDYQSHNYTKYSEAAEEDEEDKTVDEPYVIPPEEFGELDDYETVSLTHYADGMLADDQDELIEDVAGAVGWDYEEHFGEYEDDSVFIRNDLRKCDYEILRNELRYHGDVVDW